jgi:heme-degrading monooxygenase HmoA
MYMSQHRFTPVPEKYDLWRPYNHNYMTLTARVPGAIWSRILRSNDDPNIFFAVGLWTDHEAAIRWTDSDESKLGAKPNVDLGLYEGYPMTWSRWDLQDFAWGLGGPAAALGETGFVKHIAWNVAPGAEAAQLTLCRSLMSLLARRPGFLCGETYLDHKKNRLLLIYTLRAAADWPLGEGRTVPAEIEVLLQSETAQAVCERAPAPYALDCELFESVWGPETASLLRFIGAAAAA